MPELPDRNPGEIIFASFSNQLIRRSVQRYVDATERDVQNPLPEIGDVAYLTTGAILQIWDGTFWTNYTPEKQEWITENRGSITLPTSSPGAELNKIVLTGSNNRYLYLAEAHGYIIAINVGDGQLSQCFINFEGDSGSVRETAIYGVSHITEAAPGSVGWGMPYYTSWVFAATEPSITVRGYQSSGTSGIDARNNVLTVRQIDALV